MLHFWKLYSKHVHVLPYICLVLYCLIYYLIFALCCVALYTWKYMCIGSRKKERQPRHITPQTRRKDTQYTEQTKNITTITNLTNKGNMQHTEVHVHVSTGQIIKRYQDAQPWELGWWVKESFAASQLSPHILAPPIGQTWHRAATCTCTTLYLPCVVLPYTYTVFASCCVSLYVWFDPASRAVSVALYPGEREKSLVHTCAQSSQNSRAIGYC